VSNLKNRIKTSRPNCSNYKNKPIKLSEITDWYQTFNFLCLLKKKKDDLYSEKNDILKLMLKTNILNCISLSENHVWYFVINI
jgi:hypothetical protein